MYQSDPEEAKLHLVGRKVPKQEEEKQPRNGLFSFNIKNEENLHHSRGLTKLSMSGGILYSANNPCLTTGV